MQTRKTLILMVLIRRIPITPAVSQCLPGDMLSFNCSHRVLTIPPVCQESSKNYFVIGYKVMDRKSLEDLTLKNEN